MTDKAIAAELNLTYNQVHYAKQLARLGRYAMNPDCNPIEQNERQQRLEQLYEADGRHDKGHPMHGLYTGLVTQQEQGE
jgi:hypothetical protein